MRYIFSSSLPIPLYLAIALLYEFFDCQDICEKPQLQHRKAVIFGNGSYQYVSFQSNFNPHTQSHHYKYSMRINLNQSRPFVNESLKRYYNYRKDIEPKFPFQVYDIDVNKFGIVSIDELFAVTWFSKVKYSGTRESTSNI
ncbi:unnamed protein product [Schistosoma curassoni]|uniref:EF-hand domain-containing protein n=1 Tax=Schistosoma curassoni TaxID=6186 RepID=A0A183KKU7_9TREM|nr:unnamed protein product [Schistosoma curassoni]